MSVDSMEGGPSGGLLPRYAIPTSVRGDRCSAGFIAWLRRKRLPLVVGALLVATGLAYSFLWAPITGRGTGWEQPGDLWWTFRSSQYVAWGDIGGIAHAVTLPGIAVVLAPVALISGWMGLSVGYPLPLPHPSAWLLLGPIEMIVGALVLVQLDELSLRHGISGRRRWALCFGEAVTLWPMIVMWGHPEDALAVGASTSAVIAAVDRRWARAGWWFGVAVVMQPLVVSLLPLLVLGLVPGLRARALFVVRSATPSACLLAIPLARNWQLTTRTILQQANYPAIDHPTPWLFIAPVLEPAHWLNDLQIVHTASGFHVDQHHHLVGPVVGTGPGHLIALALSLAVGIWAWWRRPSIAEVVWLAAACLTLRCVFESVENPYYVWPALALILVGVATRGGWRLPTALLLSLALTVFAEYHLSPWGWYLPVVGMLGAALVCAWPGRGRSGQPLAPLVGGLVSPGETPPRVAVT